MFLFDGCKPPRTNPSTSDLRKQEHIELETLALQGRLDEERNRSQLLEDADRYVILLVKRPLLAMRYQLPNGKVHMHFPSQELKLTFKIDPSYTAELQTGVWLRRCSQCPV